MNTKNIHHSLSCLQGYIKNTFMCEKREKSLLKPFVFYMFHLLLPLPVVSLFELDWNPFHWSVYTHLMGMIWIVYSTMKFIKILQR